MEFTNIKHILAISSGKGGVGKSTISVNLSISLAKKKFKVGLLDADIYGPSIPTMMNQKDQPKASTKKKILPFCKYGVKFMSIGNMIPEEKPVIWRGAMVVNALNQLLRDIEWGDLDFLIIDLPPGTGDIQLSLSQNLSLSGAIIVSTPQEISLVDVRRAINMFLKVNVKIIGVIQNMSYFQKKISDEPIYIFGKDGAQLMAKKQQINFLGEVPIFEEISSASDSGIPQTTINSSRASHTFDKIAKNVINEINNFQESNLTIEID